MVKSDTYRYLVDYCARTMEKLRDEDRKGKEGKLKPLRGLGMNAYKYLSVVDALLADLFERSLCGMEDRPLMMSDDMQCLYVYNGEVFECVTIQPYTFVAELAKRTLRELRIGSIYVQSSPVRMAKAVIGTLGSTEEYVYKADRRYIAFANGIFDLGVAGVKGKLRKFDIKYRPYIRLDIPYMDESECWRADDRVCSLWERKLTEKNNGKLPGIIPDSEIRDAFQQWCGSLLLDPDVYSREYVCYLIGPGANGKSVLANVVSGVFGGDYFSHFTPRQLFKDSDRGANIAALRGKIANLCDDLTSMAMCRPHA